MEELQIRPGDVVASKYRVEKVLGAGGMGVVVAARHVTLGNLFAIKVMQPRAVAVKGAVERFEREAQAAAQLRSKHVMKVHDHGKLDSGAPYMVMEHLTGSDLASVIEQRGAVPVAEAAEYLLQACEAIAEAHAKGIVHRDLKPANLFLETEPDGTPLIKVLDFGIAKVAGAEKGLTGTSQGMGSGGYMSPEQMASAKQVDHRADIWALGVTLYELLTAHRPFEADSLEQFVARVFYSEPTPLSEHRADLPRELEAIVLRCLEKTADDRFSSVAQFAHLLAPYAPPRAHGYVARIARQLGMEAPGLSQTSPGLAPGGSAPAQAAATAFGPAPAVAVAAPARAPAPPPGTGPAPHVQPPHAQPPLAQPPHAQPPHAPTGPLPVGITPPGAHPAAGPSPVAGPSGAYPAASTSGPYPAAGASGPYPAAGASGPYPAAGASGPYPAAGASGPYPAAGASGPYPAAGQTGPQPAIGQTGPYPGHTGAASPPIGAAGQSGPYPAQSGQGVEGRRSSSPALPPGTPALPAPPAKSPAAWIAIGAVLLVGLGGGGAWLAMRPSATPDPAGATTASAPSEAASNAAPSAPSAAPPPSQDAPAASAEAPAASADTPATEASGSKLPTGKKPPSGTRPTSATPSATSTWTPLATDPKGVGAPKAPGGPRN